jgi:hypothetical protein
LVRKEFDQLARSSLLTHPLTFMAISDYTTILNIMSGIRRQGRPSTSTPVNNIPNTRTMGNVKLRAFIDTMDTPDSLREALGEHLGIPSVRNRLQLPRLDVIAQRVGNIAQRRKDMVPIGIRYANRYLLFYFIPLLLLFTGVDF